MTSIALLNREKILLDVAAGKRLADIARDLGLAGKGQAISNALSSDPEYQQAREYGLAAKLDMRESELETCEPQDVPRTRELLSHARWRAERECARIWGNKQELTVTSINLSSAIQAARHRSRVIEQSPPQIESDSTSDQD